MTADRPAPASRSASDGRRPWLLAIDTATSQVVVAAAALDGTLLGATTWAAGRTHGAQLLPAVGRLHGEANLRRSRIRGVIVGTGPGAFTGLRVGLATAKAIAHELGVPVVLLLPAGPNDRHVVRAGQSPRLLPGGTDPDLAPTDVLVAVDLDGRAPDDAVERGERARRGLAAELVAIGVPRLAHGGDDLARLVPEYVTLPRGVSAESGEVAWSRDPR